MGTTLSDVDLIADECVCNTGAHGGGAVAVQAGADQ